MMSVQAQLRGIREQGIPFSERGDRNWAAEVRRVFSRVLRGRFSDEDTAKSI